ncbi:MAG: VOC family protein [Acidimicrobiales bacterium]
MNVLLVASVAPIVRDPGPSAHLARRGSRPQASIEFEVDDVAGAATELEAAGHRLIHAPRPSHGARRSPVC